MFDYYKIVFYFNEYEWGYVVVEDNEGSLVLGMFLFYEYFIENEFIQIFNVVDEFVELVR